MKVTIAILAAGVLAFGALIVFVVIPVNNDEGEAAKRAERMVGPHEIVTSCERIERGWSCLVYSHVTERRFTVEVSP